MLSVLTVSWLLLIVLVTYIQVVRVGDKRKQLKIRLNLWYLSFLLYALFGLGCTVEYLFFGNTGITNRWTLRVLTRNNVCTFSFLWLIGAFTFVIGSIIAVTSFRRKTTYQPVPVNQMSQRDLILAVHLAFLIFLFSAIHMDAFQVSLNRTAAMWSGYEASMHRIDLPYKVFFIIYFTLTLFLGENLRNRAQKKLFYIHLSICIAFAGFYLFVQGGRLVAIQLLFTYIAFKTLKNKTFSLRGFIIFGVILVGGVLAIYQWRGQIMALLLGRQIQWFPQGRLSLLEGDGGIAMYVTNKCMEGLQYPPFLNFIIYIIPRFLWHSKPDPLSVAFNRAYGAEGGFGIPMVAAGIVNFGVYLCFLQTFIAGCLTGLLDSLKYSRSRLAIILYVSSGSLFFYAVIADLGQFLAQIIWRLITISLILGCVKLIKMGRITAYRSETLQHEY